MASVHRRPKSPYWWGRYPVGRGKWDFRSTKLTDRKKALFLVRIYHEKAKGDLPLHQAQKQVSEIYANLNNGQKLPSASIGAFLDKWLERKKAEVSPATLDAYRNTFNQFKKHLGPRADLDLKLLTRDDIVGFRQEKIDEASLATARQHIKKLNVALNDASHEGIILANVGRGLTHLRRDPSTVETRAFTKDEIRRIDEAIDDPEWRGMFLFGLYTGQRLKDVAVAEWAKTNLNDGYIHLFIHKKNRWEKKFLARPLWAHLQWMKKKSHGSALFPRAHSLIKRRGLSNSLSNQFKVFLVRAGLLGKEELSHKSKGKGRSTRRTRKGVGFHSLRHGATSLLKQAGVPHAVAQEIVGHDSKEISQHYTHVGDDAIRSNLDKIPSLHRSVDKPKTKKGKK